MNDEKLLPTVIELNTLLADYHIYYQNLIYSNGNFLGFDSKYDNLPIAYSVL
jgi:starvation-inducible DNA-binding protein